MRRTIEKIYCDRCNKEMPDPHRVGFKVNHKTMGIKRLTNEWGFIDLCDDCVKSFGKWFEGVNEE